MDNRYVKAESSINGAVHELKTIFQTADRTGTEDREARCLLEALIEKLKDAEREIHYLASPVREGILIPRSNGKFSIRYSDKTESNELNCGSALEVYVESELRIGRVESAGGKYYLSGAGRPFLYSGMKVRKRVTR